MKITPKTYRIVAKFWPLICGLIIGSLLGGIMQSFSAFLLFGSIGWAYFHFDFFHMVKGRHCEKPYQGADESLREEMDCEDEEVTMGAAGIEPYATIYGFHHY